MTDLYSLDNPVELLIDQGDRIIHKVGDREHRLSLLVDDQIDGSGIYAAIVVRGGKGQAWIAPRLSKGRGPMQSAGGRVARGR